MIEIAQRQSCQHVRILLVVQALDVTVVVGGQLAGAREAHHDLQEAVAHQEGAQRHRRIDDPGRPLEVGRGRPLEEVAGVAAEERQRLLQEAMQKKQEERNKAITDAQNAAKQGN